MIPEFGQFALVMALITALLLATLPLIGAAKNIPAWISVARPLAQAQFLSLTVSFGCLIYIFIQNDFSVLYAANNSNTRLPLEFRISAVWGAHEGSLLLWALTLGVWTSAVAIFSKKVPDVMIARVLSVMGFISIGFILFILVTSNPFERIFPAPLEGRDLNPLLQDFGLIIHPPMLYMGYVGLSVAFAFAIAAMLAGKLDAAWARWSRPWTSIAWVFLTLGISLGSWWAYYELGWGGWWFWDPVENASFMPWLVATALIHSLAVTEKRGSLKAWTVLLAIFAFSLSLLGTFLVRSGVLTSVHSFASDPERGLFILIFLVLVVGSSLALYAWRAPAIKSNTRFSLFSKETALLLNNILLVVATATILLGTLYPLVIDALNLGKISVGPPYFNSVFVPIMVPLVALMSIGVFVRWKQDSIQRLKKHLLIYLVISLVLGALSTLAMPTFTLGAMIGTTLAWWVVLNMGSSFKQRFKAKAISWDGLKKTPRAIYGMHIAHVGIAVFTVGVTLTSIYSTEKDVLLTPGESYSLAGYDFKFINSKRIVGPNYQGERGHVIVSKDGVVIADMEPEKRTYTVQRSPMTEAAIDAGLFRDLFVAMGEPRGNQGGWALRLYHKPFIRWIWLGTLIMGFGGLLAATDKRYRKAK
ncbi:Cytochrome c heme lyase subunit CcmF [hydrothermal vent metagenome]|uniref:Cytochrome c heme lyase subunit CcmF n=1 Tax=hydrothermal vent metagenome TaxID=652676 RepID=A0A3B1AEZ1_9ZZZZ